MTEVEEQFLSALKQEISDVQGDPETVFRNCLEDMDMRMYDVAQVAILGLKAAGQFDAAVEDAMSKYHASPPTPETIESVLRTIWEAGLKHPETPDGPTHAELRARLADPKPHVARRLALQARLREARNKNA